MVSRLDPGGCHSLDGVVLQEATLLWLEPEHLAGRVVEGPGEAGTIVGTGLGTLLPVRDRGLGEREDQSVLELLKMITTVLVTSVSPASVKMILSSAGHQRSAG